MKKIVFVFLFAATACSKEEEVPKCYECEMTYAGGLPASIQYPCTTNLAEWQKAQKDNNGDPITSSCKAL
ncbi:hypothetical protein HRG84_22005 [Flavisolibacter sp. BT320]|nr:hypothetical protein [Flavisolibacter longurius]